jgi:hypothetical protein
MIVHYGHLNDLIHTRLPGLIPFSYPEPSGFEQSGADAMYSYIQNTVHIFINNA